jgi:hypothetical protein
VARAYGGSFDRQTERHIPEAGLELVESRYVTDDLPKLLTARVSRRQLHLRSSLYDLPLFRQLPDVIRRDLSWIDRGRVQESLLVI